MDPKSSFSFLISFFVAGCLVAVALQVYLFSPLSSPQLLYFPPESLLNSILPPNTHLQEVIKIGEGLVKDPEDVCVDKDGILYTASRDGWIKRLHKNGTLENWKWINSSTLLGITATATGDIIVCDTQEGLLKVNEDGITVLVSHFNGSKLRLADDVIEAKDGSLYFSIGSTKFGLHECYLDVLEAKPHGQLLKYNPETEETSLVLDNLFFANGVALSNDKDYLLVCESWKFRCLKYWLQGDLKGKTEIFIENLPGAPDNINLAPDGSFWVALLQLTTKGLEFVHASKIAKHIVATFPRLVNIIDGTQKKAMVIKVAVNGTILRRLDDPEGKVMSFLTSAVEHEGNLYLGSLNADFIGKLPISDNLV